MATESGGDLTKLWSVVVWCIGLACTMFSLAVGARKMASTSGLGRLVCVLLVLLGFAGAGCVVTQVAQCVTASVPTVATQLFGAFLFAMGVALASVHVLIAAERYCLIVRGTVLPASVIIAAVLHVVITIIVLVWSFMSTVEFNHIFAICHQRILTLKKQTPDNYRVPGAPLQRYVCLAFVLQYMIFSFAIIFFCYLRTFAFVYATIRDMQILNTKSIDIVMKRVLYNCVLIVLSFVACYSVYPITCIILIFNPEWQIPVVVDVIANCLVALDSIITPLLALHLFSDLDKRRSRYQSQTKTMTIPTRNSVVKDFLANTKV